MKRFSSTTLKTAFVKSIPIFCSYVFVSMAYGMMMASAGFPWYDSLLVSLTVYTGAFQFVLITFLSSGASLITIALTALLMNRRLPVCADHIFKQRSFYYNSGSHSTADEQPPEFLQHYLPEGIQTDGAPQAVHDSHDDR